MYDINNFIYGHDISNHEIWQALDEIFDRNYVVPKNTISFTMEFPYSGHLDNPGYIGIELNPLNAHDNGFDISVFNISDEVKQEYYKLLQGTVENIIEVLKEALDLEEVSQEEYDEWEKEVNQLLVIKPQFHLITSTS